ILVGGLLLVLFKNKGQLILDNTPEFLDYCSKSNGLVFFGPIGSGKTAILAMLANELPGENKYATFPCQLPSGQLISLYCSNCLELEEVNCSKNKLNNLKLDGCSELILLNFSNNHLTKLDLSQNPKLIEIDCENNPELVSLKGGKGLRRLSFKKGGLKYLDLSQCEELIELDCSDNLLNELDLTKCSKLEKLNCSNNLLIILDLTSNLNLIELLCYNKKPNHEKLTDITFAPDFESFKLERINLIGNDKLDYVAIDKKFLKRLPEKFDYESPPAISKEKYEKIILNKVAWYAVRLVVYKPLTEEQKKEKAELENQLKVTQQGLKNLIAIHGDKVEKKVEELKEKLNSDNPILAIYSSKSGFFPDEIIERTVLPKEAIEKPNEYLRPTDMRPEKIREHISQAVLAEYGAESYNFLGNNCEHFATLCVCGIPFSTQADKISMLTNKIYLDLAQEIKESEEKFNQMSTQENFHYEVNRLKEYYEKKAEEFTNKDELTDEEKQQLANLGTEIKYLEELQYCSLQMLINISDTNSEIDLEQIIKEKAYIPTNTVVKIIPCPENTNKIVVINKVAFYAVRLLEYNPNTKRVKELRKSPKNTLKKKYSSNQDLNLEELRQQYNEISESISFSSHDASSLGDEPDEKLRQAIEKEIKEKTSSARIERIAVFSTLQNKYAIVISKALMYAVRLIIYDSPSSGEIQIISIERFPELENQVKRQKTQIARLQGTVEFQSEELEQLGDKLSFSTKNILIVGHTGSGKSTLANVLTNTNKFKESDGVISETKSVQIEEVEENGVKYRVIDTLGFSDNTGLSRKDILNKIAETAYSIKGGISQVLFVTKDRFSEEEILTYELLNKTIFDNDINNYVTIVRTNSRFYDDNERLEQEKEKIIANGGKLSEVLKSCNEKIIFIDNPPTSEKDGHETRNNSLKKREASRSILLSHLKETCRQKSYKPENLKEFNGEQKSGRARYSMEITGLMIKEHEETIRKLNERLITATENMHQQTLEHVKEKTQADKNQVADNSLEKVEVIQTEEGFPQGLITQQEQHPK
ncbi:15728_t:CDS:10, partial [Cetraspora pellucida]